MTDRRIVITGIGIVAPNGSDTDQFGQALQEGRSGIRFFEELEALNFQCRIGGLPDITSSKYFQHIDRYHLSRAGISIKYSFLAAMEAWIDSGFTIPDPDSELIEDTGIIIGSTVANADLWENIVTLTNQGKPHRLGSYPFEQIILSSPAAYVAGVLGLGNLVTANSYACASGIDALITGAEHIRAGGARRMLIGGVDPGSFHYWAVMDAMRVTTPHFNNAPEKGSRPMSASASGFVPAAGAGMLMIEDLDTAQARGASIYAEFAGGYRNCGGQRDGGTMTAINPTAMHKCLNEAIRRSKVSADRINLISGHLTSTKADKEEVRAWAKVINCSADRFPMINSLKSMTGHPIAAAGAMELVALMIQMKHQFVFPSINSEDLHPEIEKWVARERIPQVATPYKIDLAAKSSFGFGDVYSCALFKKFE